MAKFISFFVRIVFSCQITPGAQIGKGTTFGYGGLGIVIHGKSKIGTNVQIGSNVTIGGNMGGGGVPVIGNNVFIATGAKLLGNIRIGDGAIIGANAVVLTDVPADTIFVGVPAKKLRNV